MTNTTEAALRDALEKARDQFRLYETLHAAKGSLDGDAKARTNCEFAEMCDRALSQPSPASSTAGEDVERLARLLCEQDGSDPDDEVIAGQAAGFENYGPRWQAMQRSEGQCGGRDYVEDAKAIIALLSLSSGEPASVAVEADILPCDVRLPPATVIRAGCSFDTLRLAMSNPDRPKHFRETGAEKQARQVMMPQSGSVPAPSGGQSYGMLSGCMDFTEPPLSMPTPASSTAGEGDDYKRGIYAAKCWLRDQQHKNPPDSLWHAAAILADRMDVALLSSSGEPASVAVEAIKTWEQRAEEHPDHEAYCVTPDMIQQRMQEEIDDLRAALSKPTPVPGQEEPTT